MFDISFFEIMIISIVTLIVVGPERLPQVARTIGHLMSKCRQFVYSVRTDIHNELRMEELKKMHTTMQESVQSIENSVRKEIDEVKSTADINPDDSETETEGKSDESVATKSQVGPPTKPSGPKSGQGTPDKNSNASHSE